MRREIEERIERLLQTQEMNAHCRDARCGEPVFWAPSDACRALAQDVLAEQAEQTNVTFHFDDPMVRECLLFHLHDIARAGCGGSA